MGNKRIKWTKEAIFKKIAEYNDFTSFRKENKSAYNAAQRLEIVENIKMSLQYEPIYWTPNRIKELALQYNSKRQFRKNHEKAYNAAVKLKILDQICDHMVLDERIAPNIKWNKENLKLEALKYKFRVDFFKKSSGAYDAAVRLGVLEKICDHMVPSRVKPWEVEEIANEAIKYSSRSDFAAHSGAYHAAIKLGILDEVCQHMEIKKSNYSDEIILKEALKYKTRSDFKKDSANIYAAASKRGILDDICSHMSKSGNRSWSEQTLLEFIKGKYPKAQTLRVRKIAIPDKPHITGFDIDIYIPEIRKGIEFDGKYHHSFYGLKRGRPNWPKEDLDDYHRIKDEYFKNHDIDILHIREEDWLEDSEKCIYRCLQFIEGK